MSRQPNPRNGLRTPRPRLVQGNNPGPGNVVAPRPVRGCGYAIYTGPAPVVREDSASVVASPAAVHSFVPIGRGKRGHSYVRSVFPIRVSKEYASLHRELDSFMER